MGESVEKRRPIVAGKEGIVLVGFENGCFILDLSNERYSGCTLTSSKFSFIFIFTVYEARNGGEQNTAAEGQSCLILISDIENSLHEFRKLTRFRANKESNRKRREREDPGYNSRH